MVKHENEQHTLKEIIDGIDDSNPESFWEIIGIEIPGVWTAAAMGDHETGGELVGNYIEAHKNDVYEVIWPEHVTTPRFNSDATYRLVEPQNV